jgi:hypothetical protein
MSESEKLKPAGQSDETTSTVVKIEGAYYQKLFETKNEINENTEFDRRIGFKRIVEVLIDDLSQSSVERLKKEREGSEDWLRALHRAEAPDVPLFDWLKDRLSKKKITARVERKA